VAAAFLAAARGEDFEGLLAVLDPDVVLRADAGAGPLGPSRLVRGAPEVIAAARLFSPLARFARPVLVNGAPGFLIVRGGQPFALIGMAIRDDKITEIDILADPDRLSQLDLTGLID
jgi:RNA polymerase sigma-70 factor (ECF subfamily)